MMRIVLEGGMGYSEPIYYVLALYGNASRDLVPFV